MTAVRLGAVSYLNARPLVCGIERHSCFSLRFDTPSRCAALLHEGVVDVGLIPSIEYLRAPAGAGPYSVVPDLAIASSGSVASVALYTTRPVCDIRSIATDMSSRTSVALVRVLCARSFKIEPAIETCDPDLPAMLGRCDAALIIGDDALLMDHTQVRLKRDITDGVTVEKIDLGETWTAMTGLPFVYAFWAGRGHALGPDEVNALLQARDIGVRQPAAIASAYFSDPCHQAIGTRYLQDNIKYYLGDEECAGLEAFYRYASEIGIVSEASELRFY